MNIPSGEIQKFLDTVSGQAQKYGLEPKEYIKKIWYHEQAAKLGEYMAMLLVDEISKILPQKTQEITVA